MFLLSNCRTCHLLVFWSEPLFPDTGDCQLIQSSFRPRPAYHIDELLSSQVARSSRASQMLPFGFLAGVRAIFARRQPAQPQGGGRASRPGTPPAKIARTPVSRVPCGDSIFVVVVGVDCVHTHHHNKS